MVYPIYLAATYQQSILEKDLKLLEVWGEVSPILNIGHRIVCKGINMYVVNIVHVEGECRIVVDSNPPINN